MVLLMSQRLLRYLRAALCFALLVATNLTIASADLQGEQLKRYQGLIAELRCLVCQNQNIADSNAPLALDLRAQVSDMILTGKSDTEIKSYLVARYGDFVLYRPPVKPQTWLLWGGPFVLLLFGLLIAWRVLRKRGNTTVDPAPDPELLANLLQEDMSESDKLPKDNTH